VTANSNTNFGPADLEGFGSAGLESPSRPECRPKLETSYALGLPTTPEPPPKVTIDEPPPFLGTWRRVYIFILCYLAVVIAGFYVFSRAYAP
jgi:hypothetical protein